MKKRLLAIIMGVLVVFSAVGCGEKEQDDREYERESEREEDSEEETEKMFVKPVGNDGHADAKHGPEGKPEDASEDEETETSEQTEGSEGEVVDITSAQEIWRVYEIPDKSPASNPYLYLDICPADGYVTFQFDFMGNNMYASCPWPMESGEYWATEFDDMGGGTPFKVYIDYSESLIKVYGYYNNDTERDEYPTELVFSSEDIIR